MSELDSNAALPAVGAIPAQSGTGIFAGTPVALVAKVGDIARGEGITFSALKDPVLNADGAVAFAATVTRPGIVTANNTAIFSNASGALDLLVQKGDGATGAAAVCGVRRVICSFRQTVPRVPALF